LKADFHITDKGTIRAFGEIRQSSEALLTRLDRKEWYLPGLQSFPLENRKQEWLSARILLKEILREEKEILYRPDGRPYFADHSYQLSISHTKGYVAVALNEKRPVGIDIERVSSRIRRVRERFMNDEEKRHLPSGNEDLGLLLYWSAKESLFKALGEEGVDFKSCLHISSFRPVVDEWSSFAAHETKTEQRRAYTIHYLANEDFVLTLAEEAV
jgi:phosphopantetheinyl transferase